MYACVRSATRACRAVFLAIPHLFGLVGARSSGKTVMLAVLMRELAMNGPVGRRFRDTIRLCKAGDNNGQEVRLERLLKQMESPSGQLPAQTQQADGDKTSPVVFEWQRARRGIAKTVFGDFTSTVFSFYDTAGRGPRGLTNARSA